MALFNPFKTFKPALQSMKGNARKISAALRQSMDKATAGKILSKFRQTGGRMDDMAARAMYEAPKTRGFTQNALVGNKTAVAGQNIHTSSFMARVNNAAKATGFSVKGAARGVLSSPFQHRPYLVVGATAMAALGIMNGAMNQANEIMYQRYLTDQRYSRNIMKNASLGKASKGPRLSMGNHVGLSIALSRNRHGY